MKRLIKKLLTRLMKAVKKNERKVIFESYTDFTDNSRALYEYMLSQKLNENRIFVWCVDNPDKFRLSAPKNVIFTGFRKKKYLLSYLYHIATAKTVFFTHARPPFADTSVQTVVCLWHGIPLKQISFSDDDGFNPRAAFSYLPSSGEFYNRAMADCFKAEKDQLVVTGFPRNDLLFQQTDCLQRLGILKSAYEKIIIWMPTFRQNAPGNYSDCAPTDSGLPLLTTRAAFIECNEKLRQLKQLLILKLHPMQDMRCIDVGSLSNIKILVNSDLAAHDIQLYHLVAQADLLLTDYSSVYLDFLLLNRPIGFIIDDIVSYSENRGFTVDDPFELMPGAQIETKEQLYAFLSKINMNVDEYIPDRARVCDLMHWYRDGGSSARITEEFLPKLK